MSDSDSKYQLYHYTPSAIAAAIFAVIFFLSTIFQAWRTFKTRSWYFSAMIIGGLMEGIGYIGRILSHKEPESLGPYIMQTLLLLVAPALFAAAIYVVLGRLIRMLHAERFSLIRLNWLTKFFVLGDVISFFLQSGGGGIMASGNDSNKRKIGQYVIIIGLLVQIIWFGGFIFVAGVFHYRMRVVPTVTDKTNWRRLMHVLYAASTMILVRSVFRVIEFAQGNDGYLMKSEVWIYIFDSVLMAGVITLFNIFHPSSYLRDDGQYTMREHEEKTTRVHDEEHATTVAPHPYSDPRRGL
ncbi:RTA1 like protein-domain-containing protein [Desarmillaria tabescens]|uniref:RTA1 like protein-domain-containing protein n=1 Tax=Armillaria tabescens TaxID=1929756 RepID=A0AA39JT65_ARMTA|nr:RTA1 like protein-domain-containing protein [Desarmillaria tabescens]KAK0448334.1 RTA1 like protein-domain-containing protein [Desarmillaria tabescens]